MAQGREVWSPWTYSYQGKPFSVVMRPASALCLSHELILYSSSSFRGALLSGTLRNSSSIRKERSFRDGRPPRLLSRSTLRSLRLSDSLKGQNHLNYDKIFFSDCFIVSFFNFIFAFLFIHLSLGL